ncbi:MAG: hypothetical protein E4H08_08940 [Candidatus Atribacteria bacterium]|nr:MAG: hypothetical protein E4H08_08940 [Candidatus Atribacteria bacterium]
MIANKHSREDLEKRLNSEGKFSLEAYRLFASSMTNLVSSMNLPSEIARGWSQHTAAVRDNLNDILKGSVITEEINDAEAFLLLAASWLLAPPDLSEDTESLDQWNFGLAQIRRNPNVVELRGERLAGIVSDIAAAASSDTTISDIFPRLQITLIKTRVRQRFLAALIRIADVFDCTYPRAGDSSAYDDRSDPWQIVAYQAILGVEFKTSEGKVVLETTLDSEEAKEALVRELAQLQNALEQTLPYLAVNGIPLLYVEAITNTNERIDARSLEMEPVRSHTVKLESFFDLHTTYDLNVLRHSDLRVIRHVTFINGGEAPVDRRRHFFYSDSSEFDLRSDLVRASSGGKKLCVEIIRDAPARTEFDIIFPEPVAPSETCSYEYEIFWPDCFPADREFFTGNDYGLSVTYNLLIPANFTLLALGCSEILGDGTHIKLEECESPKPESESHERKGFTLTVRKGARSSNTMLYWTWRRK